MFSIVKSSKERVDPLSGDKAVMQTGAVTLLTSHLEGDLEGGRDSLRGAGPWWQKTTQSNLQKRQDLPGCPVVETLGFQCRGLGRSPGWGTNISHAMLHGQKNRKKKKSINSKYKGPGKFLSRYLSTFLSFSGLCLRRGHEVG